MVITHYNSKIHEGETRSSFTQYAAGSIFCSMDNGIRADKVLILWRGWPWRRMDHLDTLQQGRGSLGEGPGFVSPQRCVFVLLDYVHLYCIQ